jgi:hypothetical protein
MPSDRPKLRFFLDNNVPDSIGRYLQGRGHSVLRQRFHIPHNSTDPAVGMTALQANRILVTWDKDFNSQTFRQARFDRLCRLSLSGDGPTLLLAVQEHVELLEFQFTRVPRGGRVVAHIALGQIRFRTN